tara:strand:+ start:258 stop:446 length:189 start_codon:yes stop_codon:yes gene_type:complete
MYSFCKLNTAKKNPTKKKCLTFGFGLMINAINIIVKENRNDSLQKLEWYWLIVGSKLRNRII